MGRGGKTATHSGSYWGCADLGRARYSPMDRGAVAVSSRSSGSRVARVKGWVRVSMLAILWSIAPCAGASIGGARVRAAVRAAVGRIAAHEGVDPRLVEAVAETESAYDPGA